MSFFSFHCHFSQLFLKTKMIKIIDDLIEADEILGPIRNFNDSFENYFIKKASDLLLKENSEKENPEEGKYNFIVS